MSRTGQASDGLNPTDRIKIKISLRKVAGWWTCSDGVGGTSAKTVAELLRKMADMYDKKEGRSTSHAPKR